MVGSVLRMVLRRLAVLFLIMVAAAVSFQLYLAFDRSESEPEESSYASIPDTGGPAKGQAEDFSRLLRARGLACSDENLAKVFSRGCYRRDFDHGLGASFLGPVDGTFGVVEIGLSYHLGADDRADAHRVFDELVGDFITAARLSTADAAVVRSALAAGTDAEFSIDWGTATLQRSEGLASSSIKLRRAGWRAPDLVAATLPGPPSTVESVAAGRGFQCQRDEWQVDCSKGEDKEFMISASRGVPSGLDRLFVSVDTGRDDTAMEAALAEAGAVLDALGGPRAAAAKDWLSQNRGTAGGTAYVGGLHVFLSVEDTRRRHAVQIGLQSPCHIAIKGGFC